MQRFARLIALIVVLVPELSVCTAEPSPAPNIVFILADDMGYGDPRCYNAESKVGMLLIEFIP